MIDNSIVTRGPRNVLNDKQIYNIREVYKECKSIVKTSEITGHSRNTINKYVKDMSSKNPHSRAGKGIIVMYEKNGKELKRFKNSFQASKKTGIRQSSISLCINHKIKSAGGFIFRFLNDKSDIENLKLYHTKKDDDILFALNLI